MFLERKKTANEKVSKRTNIKKNKKSDVTSDKIRYQARVIQFFLLILYELHFELYHNIL